MGKDLKGKELGAGIVQRKDGKYAARFVGKTKKGRKSIWFDFWLHEIKEKTTRPNTVRNYRERYEHNIRDVIGDMVISEVKPMHCQKVLNLMEDSYKGSTIEQCRITMASMFFYAQENQIIPISPVVKSVKTPKKIEKKVRFLTLEE